MTIYNEIVKSLENNPIVAVLLIIAVTLVSVATLLKSLATIKKQFHKKLFTLTAKSPFPYKLTKTDVEEWMRGDLQLADLQIRSYLNNVNINGNWVDTCLSNVAAFGAHAQMQVNREYKLKPSKIDSHNQKLIRDRLDQLDQDKAEENKFLQFTKLYERLAERSKSQLLYYYKDSEVLQLKKGELYLLRNQIYAHHGRLFSTPKLHKYFSRKSWYKPDPNFNLSLVNPIEICNAFFLNELNPEVDLSTLGRAIFIDIGISNGSSLSNFPASVEDCLNRNNTGIEVHRSGGKDYEAIFRDYADLLILIRQTKHTSVSYSSLNQQMINKSVLTDYPDNEQQLIFALEKFSSQIQKFLTDYGMDVQDPNHQPAQKYIGVSIGVSEEDLMRLKTDNSLRDGLGNTICKGAKDFLEIHGPTIPTLVQTSFYNQTNTNLIFEKPVNNGILRRKLSLKYLKDRYNLDVEEPLIDPKIIVIHWTARTTLYGSYKAFKAENLSIHRRGIVNAGKVNVGTHFLVGRDGLIYRLLNERMFARHTIGLNFYAIGIENIGGTRLTPLTDAQLDANEKIVRILKQKYPSITWLIGHHEYDSFRESELWLETDPNYFTHKIDPGPKFMSDLRTKLSDIALQGPYAKQT